MTPKTSYRIEVVGHKRWPNHYDECPECGKPKTKHGKLCLECRVGPRTVVTQPVDPSYRFIPLTQGKWAIVDTADYEYLMHWMWHAQWNPKTKSYYAAAVAKKENGKQRLLLMHRLVLKLEHGDKREVDHALKDTLDNRRFVDGDENLRFATHAQNMWNRGKNKNNSSGFKCVYFRKRNGKWYYKFLFNGVCKWRGYFDTPELAHAAYCEAVEECHGVFARFE